MTMDYANLSRTDIKMPSPRISSNDQTQTKLDFVSARQLATTASTTNNVVKRSFDVAFLMLPDEKLKNKQNEKHQRLNSDAVVTYPTQISVKSNESLRHQINREEQTYFEHINDNKTTPEQDLQIVNPELINNNEPLRRFASATRSPRIYDDPSIIANMDNRNHFAENDMPKSAFTKVPRQESPPPLSPDQMSCPSSSPPVSTSPPRHIIYQNFRPEYRFVNSNNFHTISQMQAIQNHKLKQQFMFRPLHSNQNGSEAPSGYVPTGFPFGNGTHPFVPQPDLTGIVRNPAAAALLTTLIPPTIATSFTLTAQNVCAKCNISFRMTSDLVYHMRSHHKSEFTNDTNRRKREEKLKCPVCNESFRERHHLTRHMTAHQDKASDEAETIQIQRRHK